MLDPRQGRMNILVEWIEEKISAPRFLFKIQMWEVSSLPGVFVENWPKFGHQVEYLLKTDRNTKRLSSVAVEAQFSNSSQGWLEIRIQSNSGRENIIRNDFISTMVVDFRKDLHFYFHRLHIFKRPAWGRGVTNVSRLVRMTDNCWDVSMCCQCAANVLPMYCQCTWDLGCQFSNALVQPSYHLFNAIMSLKWISHYFLDSDDLARKQFGTRIKRSKSNGLE